MDTAKAIEASKDELNRVLAFFPRVEFVMSVALGANAGMLALLATNAPPLTKFEWPMGVAILTLFLIVLSLWHVYQGYFPQLAGGHQSLIYFREIAARTEANFIEEFKNVTEDAYLKDLLGQIWRNSEILKKKYDHLKLAFLMLALAIVPWVISLVIFSAKNSEAKSLLVK